MYIYSAVWYTGSNCQIRLNESERLPCTKLINDLENIGTAEKKTMNKVNAKGLEHSNCISRLELPDKIWDAQVNLNFRNTTLF